MFDSKHGESGASTPWPDFLTDDLHEAIEFTVIVPSMDGLLADYLGRRYPHADQDEAPDDGDGQSWWPRTSPRPGDLRARKEFRAAVLTLPRTAPTSTRDQQRDPGSTIILPGLRLQPGLRRWWIVYAGGSQQNDS